MSTPPPWIATRDPTASGSTKKALVLIRVLFFIAGAAGFCALVMAGKFFYERYVNAMPLASPPPNTWKSSPDIKDILDARNESVPPRVTNHGEVPTWADAEVEGRCSLKDQTLGFTSPDEPQVKQVILQCMLKNLSGNTIPVPKRENTDTVARLPNGSTVRADQIFLASSKKEIPAHGEIAGVRLWLLHKCKIEESDSTCALEGLMQGRELLLLDTTNKNRYHIFID
jgi:hypothetical protein